jgi:hypothetical protein
MPRFTTDPETGQRVKGAVVEDPDSWTTQCRKNDNELHDAVEALLAVVEQLVVSVRPRQPDIRLELDKARRALESIDT